MERRLLGLAEGFFHRGRMAEALRLYRRLASGATSPLAPYATYKMGWCQLNLRHMPQALSAFVTVLRHPRSRPRLRSAARRDVARVYVSVGRPARAYNFFVAINGNALHGKQMLRLLGDMYLYQGQFANAEKVFAEHLRRWPKDPARCTWAKRIVQARIRRPRALPTFAAVGQMVRILASLRSQHSARHPSVVACRKSVRGVLGGLARRWRAEANATKNRSTEQLAHKAEQLYQKLFRTIP